MRTKKLLKRLSWAVAIVIVVMNVMAAMHAYKFTHFTTKAGVKRFRSATDITTADKLKMAISGIDYPRPVNERKPDRAYEVVTIKSNKKLEGWLIKTADRNRQTVTSSLCSRQGSSSGPCSR